MEFMHFMTFHYRYKFYTSISILSILFFCGLFLLRILSAYAQEPPTSITSLSDTPQSVQDPSAPLHDRHYSIGNYIWLDYNNNGRVDANEPPAPDDVVLSLLHADGRSAEKVALTSNGYYLFRKLNAGQYRVQILAGNFITESGKLAGYTHSTGIYQIADPNQDIDQVDHGLDDTDPPVNGIVSGIIEIDQHEPLLEEPTSDGIPGSDSEDQPDAEGNLTLDMGVAPIIPPPLSLGNQLWYDEDRNGLLDLDEDGINDIDVQLYRAGQDPLVETPLATQTTSRGGYYTFTNLLQDTYFVYIPTPPAAYPQSTSFMTTSVPITATGPITATDWLMAILLDNEVDKEVDNDNNGIQITPNGAVQSPPVTLEVRGDPISDGDDVNRNLTIDFGFVTTTAVDTAPLPEAPPELSLGNLVWYDVNGDGITDDNEPGIPRIEVQLFTAGQNPLVSTPIYTQTTSSSGHFIFTGLEERTYFVYIPEPPSAYPLSSPSTNTDSIAAIDNKGIQLAPGGPVQSAFISLEAGREPIDDGDDANSNLSIDFGFIEQKIDSYTIGDRVWHDVNNNGLLGNSELGVRGVTLHLYQADANPAVDIPLQTATTDLNGYYRFEDIQPDTYFIYIPKPPIGFPNSSTVDGWLNEKIDGDDNGLQKFASAPVYTEDFSVPLPQGDSLAVQAAQTDVKRVNIGSLQSRDTVEVIDTIDFGFFSSSISIGDRVWFDDDGDGLYEPDDGEAGVSGVKVTLYDITNPGQAITSTETRPNGTYRFLNILPGEYYLIFDLDTLPPGHIATRPDFGLDEQRDSDAHPVTGRVPVSGTINATQIDDSLDMGIIKTASIGDMVWYDTDRDGIQSAVETGLSTTNSPVGIPGVQVKLIDGQSGAVLMSQTTGSDGQYRFDTIAPGQYYVEFDLPQTYLPSPKDVAAGTDVFDSDADYNNSFRSLRTELITLRSGEHNPTVDLGAYLQRGLPVSIGDYVWFDSDRDGTQGSNEFGMPDVTVELHNESEGTISRAITDRNGHYSFQNLVPGNYQLNFVPPAGFIASPQNAGTDSSRDSDIRTATGRTVETVLSSAEVDRTWDAGFYTNATLLSSIGDRVWHDANLNGIQDEQMDVAGIADVVVTLYREDGNVVGVTETDEQGIYHFANIISGVYSLGFDPPSIYEPSQPFQGIDRRLDSDVEAVIDENGQINLNNLRTKQTLLTPLENEPDFDAGFYVTGATSADNSPSIIGNRVWRDNNQDGYQDSGEKGIAEVIVKLSNELGELVAVTQTDSQGNYFFLSVVPGTYYLEFVLPNTNYIFSPRSTNLPKNADSDVSPLTGRTDAIVIETGSSRRNLDAGMIDSARGWTGKLYTPLFVIE